MIIRSRGLRWLAAGALPWAALFLRNATAPAGDETARTAITARTAAAVSPVTIPAAAASAATTATASRTKVLRIQGLARAAAEARVPALERGGLKSIDVEPGAEVAAAAQLATLDDREAALTVELAERDLQNARHKLDSSRRIEIAAAAVEEGRRQLEETIEQADAAELLAADESPVQLARKLEELAADKLERARVSREQSERSVPAAEWFALQNEWDQSRIRTAAAIQERATKASRSRAARSLVEQHRAALQKLELQFSEAQADQQHDALQLENLRTTLEIATARLARRHLTAPFSGVVVERLKQPGEWCEAGEAVVRILQLNPLHLEGFVAADAAARLKPGQKVQAQPTKNSSPDTSLSDDSAQPSHPPLVLDGRLIFVSPEVDALNAQVRIRAEVANPQLQLRPGENVLLTIHFDN